MVMGLNSRQPGSRNIFLFSTEYYTTTEKMWDLAQSTNLERDLLCSKCFLCPEPHSEERGPLNCVSLSYLDCLTGQRYIPTAITGSTPDIWWESSIELLLRGLLSGPIRSYFWWNLNRSLSKGSWLREDGQKAGGTWKISQKPSGGTRSPGMQELRSRK